jgi:hypothetical protein
MTFNERSMSDVRYLRQTWWTPVAAVLVVAQLWVTAVFVFGDGTSNVLDAESRAAGVMLAVGGAIVLAGGLWFRPHAQSVGNALVLVGAALAAIWFWTVVITPLALVVIGGVVVSQIRPTPATRGTP